MKIEMVDLKNQYLKIQNEIDSAIFDVVSSASFINGSQVSSFTNNLSKYLGGAHVIPCANGTDALQIAMMALDLKAGDEIIIPSFTYVATAEVIGLLNLTPVMVDVDPDTFTIKIEHIQGAITKKTKAIIPVHLYGQCADMEPILEFAKENGIYVIEDAAQAIGAKYTFKDGAKKQAGTMGDIGCTSFFPSKNLGCFGDGGAIFTNDEALANKIRIIANHGQEKKYIHKYIGVNSRLDTLQAAILDVKLKYLDYYIAARQAAADVYDSLLSNVIHLQIPRKFFNSSHVFHQYTMKIAEGKRDGLKKYLGENGIPSMVYYPIPLNNQEAYKNIGRVYGHLEITNQLCHSVLSIPMHTELTDQQQLFITNKICSFLKD